jgi:DNA-binding transcriptional LysR family regulator
MGSPERNVEGEAGMELMQLEMFVAVVEERSVVRAAERVFRTQPAVTMGLRKLENKLSVPLLDRATGRTGSLTPAGERLFEYAQKILGLRDEALASLKRPNDRSGGTLSVGLVGEESLNRFPPLWNSFRKAQPNLEVKMHLDNLGTVLGELAGGHLDVALVSGHLRCDATGKNLLVTRLRQPSCPGLLWVLRPRLGSSPLAHAFEKAVVETGPARPALPKPKRIPLPGLRVVR